MKNLTALSLTLSFVIVSITGFGQRNDHYITNQAPLVIQPYTALPLGDIKPQGWLLTLLELQKEGLTGHLDSIYALVCGDNNGWLGGSGDGWERGPYWLDGLVPLAYILDDQALKDKALPWVEWSIKNQREDGYFGPVPLPEGYEKIQGTQQGNREDWWPKMVMLKVLQQYYSATEDKRVIDLMTRYFKYQLNTLPDYPLGNWTFWGNRRGGDNLAVVYWLYNITREAFLLELGEIIHKQTYNWTEVYDGDMIRSVSPLPRLHCVNVAQGLKAPAIYYQRHPEEKYLQSIKSGLQSLKEVHGFVNGMYGGDERLHGNDPTQGSELCSATEMMFSFENILPISGDMYFADYLEKIAFNVLPTQHDDHFTRKQYFQQANQVLITDQRRNFVNDDYARIVYGVLTGYPCCTTNMHQGWPKFVQNLWYATSDNGLAALVYGASEVTATVGKGVEVHFREETDYPFRDKISFYYESKVNVTFPLHLRIPGWCKNPMLLINDEDVGVNIENNVAIINRAWKQGDRVDLILPMAVVTSEWSEGSIGIERGPLVYALRVEEKWQEVKTDQWPSTFYEVLPQSAWNYGILRSSIQNVNFKISMTEEVNKNPWNLANAPISLNTSACRIPDWQMYNHSAGKVPIRVRLPKDDCLEQEITLIPYGCSTLRISQFPVVNIVRSE